MSPTTRARLVLAGLGPAVVGVGLAARFGLTGAIADSLGVALWSVLVFLIVLFVRPTTRPVIAGLITLAISFAVELFQMTGIPLRLADVSVLFRLVLGTHFDAGDLPGYAVGCAVATVLHLAVIRRTTTLAA